MKNCATCGKPKPSPSFMTRAGTEVLSCHPCREKFMNDIEVDRVARRRARTLVPCPDCGELRHLDAPCRICS